MINSVKVRVPGTTANCGPGFDAVGMACTIYNDMELILSKEGGIQVEVSGEGTGLIAANERNIAVQAVQAVLDKVGEKYCGISIKMVNQIPLSRGLGSSAAAIVAGLVAANAATGGQLSRQELLNMATFFEGHPDNVAPAIMGGVTISVSKNGNVHSLRFVPPQELDLIVAIPEFTLPTKVARKVLPQTLPFADAVFNVSRTALLIGALCQGQFESLKYALEDKVHQPYRKKLITGIDEVFKAAVDAGALGATISGAGPTLIAFAQDSSAKIGESMVNAFAQAGIKSKYQWLKIDCGGAKII
jgi:homoserine kinase